MLSVGDRHNRDATITGFGNQVSGPPIGVLEPGPVWHASAAAIPPVVAKEKYLWRAARKVLTGVGNADLGEWEEFTGYAFHLRRRLSKAEEGLVGVVVDVRGTPEAVRRFEAMRPVLSGVLIELAAEELASKG